MLHAHLPYVRHPEHKEHLEERWLFEAITETYVPLLEVFENLLSDRVDFRITLSLTPTLLEMLRDGLLMERYRKYLAGLIELSEKEIFRTRSDRGLGPVAKMYHKRFLKTRHLFEDVYRGDLTAAFGSLSGSGRIELITSAATHAYLPALMTEPLAVRAQILMGTDYFKKTFGRDPAGMWLPECGFTPGLDPYLKEAGINYFFLESHGLLNSIPRPRCSIYAPLRTPSGVSAFARDVESSKQVWSSAEGYPGDFDYRDFYRDIGFDLDPDYIQPYLPGGIRTFTGLKYYRITDKTADKKPYILKKALEKAELHADHFLKNKLAQVAFLHEKLRVRPIITAAYDAELFGHWWFEGPQWLDFVLRKGAERQRTFRFVTPSEHIAENERVETAMPSLSSWGNRGYSSTWVDASNAWTYRHLDKAAEIMIRAAQRHHNASGLKKRSLDQAARELLLAQASDWSFMMKTGNAAEFAREEFTGHMKNFLSLHREISSGRINSPTLAALELKNKIFSDMDFRIYR